MDRYTISFINDLSKRTGFKLKLDNTIIKIDKKTKVAKENFCLVLFLRKADLIAIIKSSLLDAIILNIQST